MEFKETAFVPTNPILISLKKKIEDKSLSFHPYLVTSAIQVEIERQLKSLIEKTFRDMSVSQLAACSLEVNEYAESEEKRYQAFMENKSKSVLTPSKSFNNTIKEVTDASDLENGIVLPKNNIPKSKKLTVEKVK